jgi:hypothetical protein
VSEAPRLCHVTAGVHGETAGHAHMDHKRLSTIKIGKQILRPPAQNLHLAACQPYGKVFGKRNA